METDFDEIIGWFASFIWGEWRWLISRTPWKEDFRARVKIHQNSLEFSILDAFYCFKKVWFFHCSLLHNLQSEQYRLTWDGKCEKFSALFSLTQAQRAYSGFQVTGTIEWGQKSKPKKSLGQNLSPKKSHAEFSLDNQFFLWISGRTNLIKCK